MNLSTKYNPGETVFVVVGVDDKAKILESTISSINITAAVSGTKVIYNCKINRLDAGTVVSGMPMFYEIERTEEKMFTSAEECAQSITVNKNKK